MIYLVTNMAGKDIAIDRIIIPKDKVRIFSQKEFTVHSFSITKHLFEIDIEQFDSIEQLIKKKNVKM